MREAPSGWLGGALAIVTLMLNPVDAFAKAGPSPLAEVAQAYGITEEQVQEMLNGETVGGELEAVSDNELALSFAFVSKLTLKAHAGRLEDTTSSDPTIIASEEMKGDGTQSLEKLVLPGAELDRLAEVEAGGDMNFSAEEIAVLQAVRKKSGDAASNRAALLGAFRGILSKRFIAYRDGGLAAIVPYDRGDGEQIGAGEQLERAFGELQLAKSDAPRVHAAMGNFPAKVDSGVRSEFFWIMHTAEDRVVVALSHKVFGEENGRLVAIDRRYYVSQILNGMQAIATAIPVQEGTVVLYANRTATDLVTGLGSSIAKKIGGAIMRRQLEDVMEEFLEDTEGRD